MTEQLEKTAEQVTEEHQDDLCWDEVWCADLEFMHLNADCSNLSIIREVGDQYVVGIKHYNETDNSIDKYNTEW